MNESVIRSTDVKAEGGEIARMPMDGTQSVRRTIAILRAVIKLHNRKARLSKIARTVGLNISTVRRILSVLVAEGFVSFDPVSKIYDLGHEFYSVATATTHSLLRDTYRTLLERVAERTGDSVYLIVSSGYDSLCLDRVEGSNSIKIVFNVGRRLPLGIGASGVALLAFLAKEEIEKILSANALRYNEFDTTLKMIRQLIKTSRRQGYVREKSRVFESVTAIGVPILGVGNTPVASISVASITERMTRSRCQDMAQMIKSEIDLIKPFTLVKKI